MSATDAQVRELTEQADALYDAFEAASDSKPAGAILNACAMMIGSLCENSQSRGLTLEVCAHLAQLREKLLALAQTLPENDLLN